MVLRAETGYPPRPDTPTPLPLPKKSRGGPLHFRYNLALVLRPLPPYIIFNNQREKENEPLP